MIEFLNANWAILGTFVGVVFWFAKLEYDTKGNKGKIKELEKNQASLMTISQSLGEIKSDIGWLKKLGDRLMDSLSKNIKP